jgi:hypothetical protein
LSGPLRRGISSHVEVSDSSSVVRQENQDIELLEGDCWHNEEVNRNDLWSVSWGGRKRSHQTI